MNNRLRKFKFRFRFSLKPRGRIYLFAGLIVLGLATMGLGIGLMFSQANRLEIPEGKALVLMDINNPDAGTLSQLSVFEDGSVLYVEDSGIEVPISKGADYTRTWRTGKINPRDIEDFFSYLKSIEFNECKSTFILPVESVLQTTVGSPKPSGPDYVPGGIHDYIRISVDNGEIKNTVVAIDYIISGNLASSELPFPVSYIYAELADIIENTNAVKVEELTR